MLFCRNNYSIIKLLILSSVFENEQSPFNTAHDDGATLKVWVVGPRALKAWAAAVRSNIKVPHLLHTVWILDV